MGITGEATSHRNASDPRQLTQPSTLEIHGDSTIETEQLPFGNQTWQ